MTAYIVNTSYDAAVTLNLKQGRVQLEPRSYCELSISELDRARKIYNSKELNLFVAETDQELELIIGTKEANQEIKEDSAQNETNETYNESNATSEETIEETSEPQQEEDSATAVSEEHEEGTSKKQEDSSSEETDQKEVAKARVKDLVQKYVEQNDLNNLKDLASNLEISYMYNIGLNSLANKILDHVEKL